jgi:small basic protein (TIGR04137 family)
MTVDRSLISKVSMARARNVYTRAERIDMLTKNGRISEGKALGLPKTRVEKTVKKVKEKKKDDAAADDKKAPAKK